MSNRLDNTRVVVFSEDYNPTGKKVLYAKDEKHYIHKDTVAKLEAKKVKLKATEFPEKAEIEKAKKALEEANKEK